MAVPAYLQNRAQTFNPRNIIQNYFNDFIQECELVTERLLLNPNYQNERTQNFFNEYKKV